MIGLVTPYADSGRSPKPSRRLAGARRGWAPTRSRSRCPPISTGRSISTQRPRRQQQGRRRGGARRGVPDGWVIGKDGKPTNDPRQLRQGGALLPMGGPDGGYKGYGLAVMVEILCGLLTGLGFGVEATGQPGRRRLLYGHSEVDAFRPLAEFEGSRRVHPLPQGDTAGGGIERRAVSRRDRAYEGTGPPQERHRCRGFDLDAADCSPRNTNSSTSSAWETSSDRNPRQRRPANALRQLHLKLQLQADAIPGAGSGAVFVSHGQPQDRRAENPKYLAFNR